MSLEKTVDVWILILSFLILFCTFFAVLICISHGNRGIYFLLVFALLQCGVAVWHRTSEDDPGEVKCYRGITMMILSFAIMLAVHGNMSEKGCSGKAYEKFLKYLIWMALFGLVLFELYVIFANVSELGD